MYKGPEKCLYDPVLEPKPGSLDVKLFLKIHKKPNDFQLSFL